MIRGMRIGRTTVSIYCNYPEACYVAYLFTCTGVGRLGNPTNTFVGFCLLQSVRVDVT